jgi:S1-C subfamily serine protease
MIGINTMIASPSGVSAGVGFAVPVNIAKRVVTELLQFGKVRRGDVDASLVPLFPQLVRYAKLTVNSGMLVSRTRLNGMAEKAGLKQGGERVQYGRSIIYLGGDIITSIGGIKTGSWSEYYSALENNRPGDKVKIEIIRDGKQMTLEITLADREELNN